MSAVLPLRKEDVLHVSWGVTGGGAQERLWNGWDQSDKKELVKGRSGRGETQAKEMIVQKL